MTTIDRETTRQIADAYRRMALEARYRPAAPSDGFGNITVPIEELDLDAEANMFVRDWWRQEDAQQYSLGCPNWNDRPAFIFAIAAASVICGKGFHPGDAEVVTTLLRMAAEEIEREHPDA